MTAAQARDWNLIDFAKETGGLPPDFVSPGWKRNRLFARFVMGAAHGKPDPAIYEKWKETLPDETANAVTEWAEKSSVWDSAYVQLRLDGFDHAAAMAGATAETLIEPCLARKQKDYLDRL
jgi:hypothetical protein